MDEIKHIEELFNLVEVGKYELRALEIAVLDSITEAEAKGFAKGLKHNSYTIIIKQDDMLQEITEYYNWDTFEITDTLTLWAKNLAQLAVLTANQVLVLLELISEEQEIDSCFVAGVGIVEYEK